MKEQELNEQVTLLKSRLNDNPQDVDAAVTLGNYYYDHGNNGQALVYYGVALKLRPEQPHVLTDMGTMYWKNGDIGIAEQVFREVIERFPDFVTAYLNLGLLLVRVKGQVQQGRLLWTKVEQEYPGHEASKRATQLLKETSH